MDLQLTNMHETMEFTRRRPTCRLGQIGHPLKKPDPSDLNITTHSGGPIRQ